MSIVNMKRERYSQTILIVDDSEMNRAILSEMLGEDYTIIEAENGVQALEAIKERGSGIDLMLLDIVMPEMDGFQVLEAISGREKTADNDIPVIMISSESDISFVERAYDMGVADYISRPFDVAVVRRRVENTLMLYVKQKRLTEIIAEQVYQKERDNNMMVNILSHIVEFRNEESSSHVINIRLLTELIFRHLLKKTNRYVLTQEDISLIGMASSLHDIGKISIPDSILNKPGRLTQEEFEIMKTHSAIGADMLRAISDFQEEKLVKFAYEICRWHHERYDGRGYPDGLAGDKIPIAAQVVALADVYDALTSERCYKKAFSHEKALNMIVNGECGAFNPLLLECMEEVADIIPEELRQGKEKRAEDRQASHIVEELLQRKEADSLMDMGMEYTGEEIAILMRCLKNIFSVVRLVDVEKTIQMEVEENGGVCATPHLCHTVWDKKTRCENCISAKAFAQKAQRTKFEFTADEIYYVVAKYVEVDGVPYSLELVSEIKDDILMGAYGEADFIKTITSYNKELYIDSLTGVYNRRYFEEQIKKMDHIEGVAMADVDNFKKVNDTYGHCVGDDVLRRISSAIKSCVRSSDIVLRYGGDEFLILFQQITEEGFERKLCQIRQAVADTSMEGYGGIRFSISIGGAYSVFPVLYAVRQADEKMYQNKKEKRMVN